MLYCDVVELLLLMLFVALRVLSLNLLLLLDSPLLLGMLLSCGNAAGNRE